MSEFVAERNKAAGRAPSAERAPAAERVHAVAVAIGERGVLVRGRSGAGKSGFAAELVRLAAASGLFARLVADDRVELRGRHGRLVARPVPPLEGLIELRGIGLARVPAEPAIVIRLVVDLAAHHGARLPDPGDRVSVVAGVELPRIVLAEPGNPSLALWVFCGGCDTVVTVPSI